MALCYGVTSWKWEKIPKAEQNMLRYMRVVEFGCYLFFKHKRQQYDQTACLAALCVNKTWVCRSRNNMRLNRAFILQSYKLNISFTVQHELWLRHRWHFVSKANKFQDLTPIANKEFEAYTLQPLETSHTILCRGQWCCQCQFLTENYLTYVISKERKSAYNSIYSCKSSTPLYTGSWHGLPTLYLTSNCLF